MVIRPEIDWQQPNYLPIVNARIEALQRIRADPSVMPELRLYYRENPVDFIEDWGVTLDPRLASRGITPIVPLILFPRQRELVAWILEKWRADRPGILEKSRDVGASWIALALSCTLCLFHNDITIGFGSATEIKVDRLGDPDSLFHKGRMFLTYLPEEFRPGWDIKKQAPHLRLLFPWTGSSITGGVSRILVAASDNWLRHLLGDTTLPPPAVAGSLALEKPAPRKTKRRASA